MVLAWLAVVLVGCAAPASTPSAMSSPSPTAAVSDAPLATHEATVTPSLRATPSHTADPSPSIGAIAQLQPDAIAVSRVNGLRVRSAPGTAAEQVSTMDAGTHLFVLSGPATDPADPDLAWWEVVPYDCSPVEDDPANEDCGYDPRIGWVTSGPQGVWLEPVIPDCPRKLTAENAEAFNAHVLACFGSSPIVLEGIVDYWCCRGITVGTTEPAWLAGDYSNALVARLRMGEQETGSWGPELRINPASGLALGQRGSIIRVTGHFDDPAAQTCRTTLSADERERYPDYHWASPQYAVYDCRLAFVVDAVEHLGFVPLPTHPPQG
jgi:hypothetical protein